MHVMPLILYKCKLCFHPKTRELLYDLEIFLPSAGSRKSNFLYRRWEKGSSCLILTIYKKKFGLVARKESAILLDFERNG